MAINREKSVAGGCKRKHKKPAPEQVNSRGDQSGGGEGYAQRSRIRRSSTTIQSERAPAKSNKTNFRDHKKRACSGSGHGNEIRHWSSREAREITDKTLLWSGEKAVKKCRVELRKTRCIICRFLPLMYAPILEYFELIRGQLLHVLEALRGRCKC